MKREESRVGRLREWLGARHDDVFVVVSPPRCSSTAVARLLWEHPSVRYYCHEPFEVTYYEGRGLDAVAGKLAAPMDLANLTTRRPDPDADALVVKEMPYQVGERFGLLADLATRPLLFLIRDPRLSIASRMRKKLEVGDNPLFPKIESGWRLLAEQIDEARRREIPHLIVDTSELRNEPTAVLPAVFARLELDYSPSILDWRPCPKLELDNLGGRHRHLYRRVLESDGLQPASRQPPPVESFPAEDRWREHVEDCVAIYRDLSTARVAPALAAAN